MIFDNPSIAILPDENTKRYIRQGANANSGSDQTEIIIVDAEGNVDPKTPIIWDYAQITSALVIPIDTETLTIRGGAFTTIVADNIIPNSAPYNRGILIRRSNVVIEGVSHYIENEAPEIGAPYDGILLIEDAAHITVRDCLFTPHFTFRYKREDGSNATRGTYDIRPTRSAHLFFENCAQTIDINDNRYWGIMCSDFCKNLTVKACSFSRVDAHQGVTNISVIGSKIGFQGIGVVGAGELTIEDCICYGDYLLSFRGDYGSHWQGNLTIRNTKWIPSIGEGFSETSAVIGGTYTGFHDFGYSCYAPTNITIDGLHIDDTNAFEGYNGMYIFSGITKAHVDDAFETKVLTEGYPYHITENVMISNYSSTSGKKWQLSPNQFMFRNVEVVGID